MSSSKLNDPDPVSRKGVSLSQLRAFVRDHAHHLQPHTTTAQVVDLIKRLTEAGRCSYVELLRRRGEPVDDATVFGSHTWSGRFLDLVAALESKYGGRAEERIWLDVMVVPQNDCDKPRGDSVWYDAFERALRETGRIAVVLAPFDRPVYLTRSWCLFEFLVAMKLGLAMDMVLAPVEEERLVAFLTRGGQFLELFSLIDFGAAEASVAEDRERIRERVVVELGAKGFRVLNERVMEQMRLLRWRG